MVALQWFHVLEDSLKVMDQVRTAKDTSPMGKVPGRLGKVKATERAKIGDTGAVGMEEMDGHGKKCEQALQEQR